MKYESQHGDVFKLEDLHNNPANYGTFTTHSVSVLPSMKTYMDKVKARMILEEPLYQSAIDLDKSLFDGWKVDELDNDDNDENIRLLSKYYDISRIPLVNMSIDCFDILVDTPNGTKNNIKVRKLVRKLNGEKYSAINTESYITKKEGDIISDIEYDKERLIFDTKKSLKIEFVIFSEIDSMSDVQLEDLMKKNNLWVLRKEFYDRAMIDGSHNAKQQNWEVDNSVSSFVNTPVNYWRREIKKQLFSKCTVRNSVEDLAKANGFSGKTGDDLLKVLGIYDEPIPEPPKYIHYKCYESEMSKIDQKINSLQIDEYLNETFEYKIDKSVYDARYYLYYNEKIRELGKLIKYKIDRLNNIVVGDIDKRGRCREFYDACVFAVANDIGVLRGILKDYDLLDKLYDVIRDARKKYRKLG